MRRRYPCTTWTHCGVNNSSVECSTCQGWVHRRCVPLTYETLEQWSEEDLTFVCRACAFSDDGTYDSIKALQRLQDAQSETIEKEKQGRSEKLLLETYEVKLPTLSGAADSNVLQVDKVSQDILGRFHPIMLETHVPVSVMGDANLLFPETIGMIKQTKRKTLPEISKFCKRGDCEKHKHDKSCR
ncbi:uncharacterized protein LOC143281356 [Babylonia areolata]|uniref:uncharacterized protein LOC143281356 n=1 Tax=Babylonia areolata TaxID=304850 RepID=UPI003FCF1C41